MAQQFTGNVEVLNSDSGQATIILEGGDDERGGSVLLGGNGRHSNLVLFDESGNQRIFMGASQSGASQSFIRLEDGAGSIPIFLDGFRAHITAGGPGHDGQLTLRNASGTDTVRLDAAKGEIVLRDWSISAPDYVFSADYPLAGLAEVEEHITRHGTLSELPSAAEVAQGGINLGPLCMLLLKKVEELTLYAIQHERLIQQQRARLDYLEQELARQGG